jgi:ipoprotein LpqH
VAAAAATLAIGGCSSGPPDYQPAPGTLVAGTAQVTVNGQNIGTTEAVQCTPAGSLTTITTGDQASGISALISNKDELTAEAVGINNVGGFTAVTTPVSAAPRRSR